MDLKLWGEANDSVCKAMAGGLTVIQPSRESRFNPSENAIIGNCALYGATGGTLYVHGIAGDRFAVRNRDRKSTRLNSSHVAISYAVFCLKKKRGKLIWLQSQRSVHT